MSSDPLPSSFPRLQSSDFNQIGDIKRKGLTFIAFYSTSCGHCHAYIPEFVKFANQNKNKASFFAVNMQLNSELSRKQFPFSLAGVPTTVVYTDSKPCSVITGNRVNVLSQALTDAESRMCCINTKCSWK
jgi:thiol-disulfide isomerase/thioredoxin